MHKYIVGAIIVTGIISLIKMSGILKGSLNPDFLAFYTPLTTLMVVFYYGIFSVAVVAGNGFGIWTYNPLVRVTVVMSVMFIFIMYYLVFLSYVKNNSKNRTKDMKTFFKPGRILSSFIFPLLVVMEWIIYGSKKGLTLGSGITAALYPVMYGVFLAVRSHFLGNIAGNGSPVPYRFLRADIVGPHKVMINVISMIVGYILLGMLLILACGIGRNF